MDCMEIFKKIELLSREQVIEAAGFLAKAITEEREPEIAITPLIKEIADHPYQHLEEIEQIARLLLLNAATMDDFKPYVRPAIEGAGQKQVILSGGEIVALATIALGALQIVFSKGKTYTEKITEIREENGKTVVKIKEVAKYGISGVLASILKKIGVTE